MNISKYKVLFYYKNLNLWKNTTIINLKKKKWNNLKNNIKLNLINQGFNVEIIDKNINNINFDETSIYEKEYNKLYNKLSKKYTSYELEQKIKQKLYQKGLFK